jgi:hypothetical protein
MKKKLMAVLLSTAMTATMLIGCGSTDTASSAPAATSAAAAEAQSQAADAATSVAAAADASTETASAASSTTYAMDKSWPKETVKIGFEAYDTTDEQFLAFQSYLEYLTKYYNVSFMYSESIASAEDELDFIDSCASAGCKGIIGYYNVAGDKAIQEAIDQGMYYWGSEQYYDKFADNDHYVGCYTFIKDGDTKNGDYLAGYQLGYSLGKADVKHVFYCNGGASMGIQMFIDRQTGFEDGIKAAQGEGAAIQYDPSSDVVEGWPGTDDFTAAVGSKLSGDYDGAAVAFNAAALFQPIADAGKADSIKVATIGEVSDTYYDAVQSGEINTVVYDCEEVVFANAVPQLLNAITGHPEATRGSDGKAGKILTNRWTITDADTYDAIYSFHDDGNYFISAEDLANCMVDLNPTATFDSVAAYYNSFDLDSAVAGIK